MNEGRVIREPHNGPAGDCNHVGRTETKMTRTVPSEMDDDFFCGRRSESMPFSISDDVEVVGGPHAGRLATVISIESLDPIVLVVEFGDDGSDGSIAASLLRRDSEEPEAGGAPRPRIAFAVGVYGELDEGKTVWQRQVDIASIGSVIRAASLLYGTELRLRVPGHAMIMALSTWGPVDASDPGRFILYDGDNVVAEDVNRDGVVEYFSRWCV